MGTRVGLLAIVLVVLVGGSVLAGWANLGHSAGLASPTLGPAPTVGSQPAVVVTPDAKPAGHKGGKKGHR
jgi:hypothetical protein